MARSVERMRAYSLDLRTRIVAAVDRQVESQGKVAGLFGVSRTFVKKLLRQRREEGDLAPRPHSGGQRPKVNVRQAEVVRAYILDVKDDASLREVQGYIARQLRVKISEATVSRLLQRLGLPRKKNAGG